MSAKEFNRKNTRNGTPLLSLRGALRGDLSFSSSEGKGQDFPLFLFGICCLLPVAFPGFGFFSAPSLGNMRQKENPGTHCCVVPWIPRSQAGLPSPLHFPESSCVCLCIIFRFLVVLHTTKIIGKNASSRKWKFFFILF